VPLTLTTPLGPGALALTALSGSEALSDLFRFRLEAVADNSRQIPFGALLGQQIVVRVEPAAGPVRYFNGICARVSQGQRDARVTAYELEVVPSFWLLARRAQSRAFQRLSIPQILERVLGGASVRFELEAQYHAHEYCVQYRETDFEFASRLMEEEGIFYFFRHTDQGHTLVVADTPDSHPELPAVQFDPRGSAGTIFSWEKSQELTAGKVTLRDHNFELPDSNLEGQATIQPSVRAGAVEHTLALPTVQSLEVYDYPGYYAGRYDGIDPGGREQPGELEKMLADAPRAAQLRMQAEAATALTVAGSSTAAMLTAGHKFALTRHFDGDGAYVLTGVRHSAEASPDGGRLSYSNSFTCIPEALPFRPPPRTPRPVVPGTQTAVVVGPPAEEIFTDKYGRVKVQFHWDREGKSSVWIRVAQQPVGGSSFLPEVGDEVLVAFEHGDVRRPYILGKLWNTTDPPPERDDK
jgi:type VI secretion system secreted protein VgrG